MIEFLTAENSRFRHMRASALLQGAGRRIDKLTLAEAAANQAAFVNLAKKAIATDDRHVVIDGHLLIETIDGPYLLPDTCLDGLPIDGVIGVTVDAAALAYRRSGVEREMALSSEEIEKRMDEEMAQAERLAGRRGVPFARVKSGDAARFKSEIANLFRN